MRPYLFFIFLLAVATISCQNNPAPKADDSCLQTIIQSEAYQTQFSKFENVLLEREYLKSTNGQAYRQLLQEASERNDFSFLQSLEIELESAQKLLTCIMANEENKTNLAPNMMMVMGHFEEAGDISPKVLADGFLQAFMAQDWDKPEIKHLFFACVTVLTPLERGISVKLPPWAEQEQDVTRLKSRNVFTVIVNAQNEILVRGEPTKLEDLREMAKAFIINPMGKEELAEDPKKAIISLKNDRGTAYNVYLSVYNELKGAYQELWDDLSQRTFGVPYSDDLSIEKRKEIQSAIPFVISEAEPTGFDE